MNRMSSNIDSLIS